MSKKKASPDKINYTDYKKTICSYITDYSFTSTFFFVLTIIAALLGVTSETPSQRNGILFFVVPFLFLIAIIFAVNAICYLPIFKETQKIKNADTTQNKVQVTKIKKKKYPISKHTTVVSVFVIYFIKNSKAEKTYYIPLHPLTNPSLKHLKGQNLSIALYKGTKIIKNFPSEIVQKEFTDENNVT